MGSGVQLSEFMVRVRCLGCRVFGSASDFAIKIPESGGRMQAAKTSGARGDKDFSKSSGREASVQGRYGRFSPTSPGPSTALI